MNDDDLPVLTQVLRIGTRRAFDVAPAATSSEPPAVEITPDHETLMADQLVIGHAPHGDLDPYLSALAFGDVGDIARDTTSAAPAANDRRGPDSFRLPQDHDGGQAPHHDGAAFDEPDMKTTPAFGDVAAIVEPAPVPPAAPPVEDPVAFARRIRNAVVEDLGARIGTELDARIAQAIHAEVETALAHLQGRLRAQLAEALRDVVGRAVDEEIDRSHAAARDEPR